MKTTLIRIVLVPAALLALSIFVCLPGCGQLKEEGRAVAKTAVDCTVKEAVEAINEYSPTVEQVLIDAIDGQGKLDKDRATAAVKTYASDTAKCVLAATIARLLSPPASSPDAPQSEPLTVDLAGLEALRKQQLGDVRYKLPGGATL